MANQLYYGDNLDVLRQHIRNESVDLVYLDPPFNSNATYNVLFRNPSGDSSQAQIEAFEDTWHWNDAAEKAFDEVIQGPNSDVAEMLRAMRSFLKDNDMMAYLTHMAVRLVELHRVLKPTGSIYLHCDPTASHYLKLLMDAVFGKECFQNEIVWSYRRWPTKANRFQRMHDTILFYSVKQEVGVFNTLYQPPTESSMKRWKGSKQKVTFDDDGARNPTLETDESSEVPLNSVWQIPIIAPVSKERLGYPTQKPVALLERILSASSNPGDVVLDPFCGCGTTVHAAEKLGRQWIGIDITHLSISLIEKRLKDAFPGIAFKVDGRPKDLDGAKDLAKRDKHEFQLWATSIVDAVPFRGGKKGADGGIDGNIYFKSGAKTTERAIVSVKGGGVGVTDIRELIAVVDRERAKIGVYISLEAHTGPMVKEAAGAGLYDGLTGKVPKIQLFTIEQLFGGKKPQIPLLERGFKTAAREERDDQSELDL